MNPTINGTEVKRGQIWCDTAGRQYVITNVGGILIHSTCITAGRFGLVVDWLRGGDSAYKQIWGHHTNLVGMYSARPLEPSDEYMVAVNDVCQSAKRHGAGED